MRILNVTPYCISNYGAILQAWALRRVLEELGHEVCYLKYPRVWPGIYGLRGLVRSRSWSSVRSKLATNRQMAIVRQEVGEWSETRAYWSSAGLRAEPPEADCYLVGSDQVFQLDFLKDIASACHVLLNFGSDYVGRVAYAASFGRPCWTAEMIARHQWAVPLLKRFSAIGLRETSGVETLRRWAGIEGVWTPDPTLLLDSADYRKAFTVGHLKKTRPCVVSYMLGFLGTPQRRAFYAECCRRVTMRLGGDVERVEMAPQRSLSYWLTTLANADYIITNSFHGICFSLLFNRPFLPLGFEGSDAWRNERARNILEHMGLLDRFLTVEDLSGIDSVLSRPFDWASLEALRCDFATVGRTFLRDALCEVGGCSLGKMREPRTDQR